MYIKTQVSLYAQKKLILGKKRVELKHSQETAKGCGLVGCGR